MDSLPHFQGPGKGFIAPVRRYSKVALHSPSSVLSAAGCTPPKKAGEERSQEQSERKRVLPSASYSIM